MGIFGLIFQLIGLIVPALKPAADAYVEDRRIAAQERMQRVTAAKEIRVATAQHWEQRLMAFTIGMVATIHWLLIGVGTNVAAPLKAGGAALPDWLALTLLVPPFPEPYDQIEFGILGFFYGYAAITAVGQKVAGAIALRRR